MNISKLIAKFVLAFFVFSSVRNPILAVDEPTVKQINQQEFEEYLRKDNIRKRGELSGMLTSLYGFAVSANFFYKCYNTPDENHPTKIKLAVSGILCGVIGAYCLYDFLKARIWGR